MILAYLCEIVMDSDSLAHEFPYWTEWEAGKVKDTISGVFQIQSEKKSCKFNSQTGNGNVIASLRGLITF